MKGFKRVLLILMISFPFTLIVKPQNDKAENSENDSVRISQVDSIAISQGDTIRDSSAMAFTEIEKKVAELIKLRTEEEIEELISDGVALFNGTKRLQNKGASCISCHTLNYKDIFHGGLLAIDLTNSFTKLNGENGLQKTLQSPPALAMRMSFVKNPLTDEEIISLIVLLKRADSEKDYQISSTNRFILLQYGLMGLLIILIIISLIWMKRKKKSVKQDIYDRQLKTT